MVTGDRGGVSGSGSQRNRWVGVDSATARVHSRRMQTFKMGILGDDLDRANRILDSAGVTVTGFTKGQFDAMAPHERRLEELVATVQAETAEEALARVRDVLPEGYTISEPETHF